MNKKKYLFLFLFSLILLTLSCSYTDEVKLQQEETDHVGTAVVFIELLNNAEYAKAVEYFDSAMTELIPEESLKDAWEAVLLTSGDFVEIIESKEDITSSYITVIVKCKFEKIIIDAKVVFDEDGKIAGLWFKPEETEFDYNTPEYVDTLSFFENEITFGAEGWELPGILTMPEDVDKPPVVILVHGSGPMDRDETIGKNKPFKDLAWGLASQGIAVLRYDKRTLVHSEKFVDIMDSLTVYHELIEDVLYAVEYLKNTGQIDSERIFVLGHSLGGYEVPKIAQLSSDIHGIIILAGNTRTHDDLIIDQFNYIFSLDGVITEQESLYFEQLDLQIEVLRSDSFNINTPAELLPLGLPASYWIDLEEYDPVKTAQELEIPILILQGERDYQVKMIDFQGWQDGLADRSDVEFISYPDLNHLFMEGEDMSTPDEYNEEGHVFEKVIEDISNWINKN